MSNPKYRIRRLRHGKYAGWWVAERFVPGIFWGGTWKNVTEEDHYHFTRTSVFRAREGALDAIEKYKQTIPEYVE